MHYLDNSATTPLCQGVKRVLSDNLDNFGNPSSLHLLGMKGLEILDEARLALANYLKVEKDGIVFTSGGTESNNLAILGVAKALYKQKKHFITTLIEHHSVLNCFKMLEDAGCSVTYLEPNEKGEITADMVKGALREDTALVSVMAVNNEVGSIMNIKEIASVVHSNSSAYFHSDCVQALGKIDISNSGADLITVSGHKIHAPKGVGALYVKKGVKIKPLLMGGGQEKNLRSGTESTLLISALSQAVKELPDIETQLKSVRQLQAEAIEGLLKIDGVVINSKEDNLPYIINFSLLGLPSEVMLHALESKQVYVSSGSACAKREKSHVLKAMKKSDNVINSAVRVSFSRFTTREDILALINGVEYASKLVRRKV